MGSAAKRSALRCLTAAGAAVLILALVMGAMGLWPALAMARDKQEDVYFVGFRQLPDPALVRGYGGEIVHTYNLIPAVAARLPGAALAALRHNPNVEYVEPDGVCEALETVPWGISRVGAAYSQLTASAYGGGVKVAILDTGIDLDHPDLSVAGGATFVDGVYSYDDDAGHGTHVAGTVAALANGIGVIGCAPDASLYAVKVLNSQGYGNYTDIVEGIDWAVANGMDIINMSLGGTTGSAALEQACDNAYAAGVLIVCAAGNNGNTEGTGDNVTYPARYDSCIAVAAIDSNNNRAYFSSTGPDVELAAPGVSVYSTTMGGGYGNNDGTSMASPHVTGVAAQVWALDPSMTNVDVRNALTSTAHDLGVSGRDTWYGYGLVCSPAAAGLTLALDAECWPDRDVYTRFETAIITTYVRDQCGLPVSGASVVLEILTPSGKTQRRSGTTNTSGYFVTSTSTGNTDGTFDVTATVSKTGYTGDTAYCFFDVSGPPLR